MIWGKNEYFFTELDANIVYFVYYGTTPISTSTILYLNLQHETIRWKRKKGFANFSTAVRMEPFYGI